MDYTVKIEGFILGTFRKTGETITLSTMQARTFLQEGRIEARARAKAASKKAPSRTADTTAESGAD